MQILPLTSIKVYFNNGCNAKQPWHVGGCEKTAISASFGNFTDAEGAIIHGVELARIYKAELIVPLWLQKLANDIADNDWRYEQYRENDSIGQSESTQPWGF